MVNKVPEGWKPAVISEIADINPKRSLPRSGEVPYLEMAALSTESPTPHYLGTKAAGASGSKFTNGDTLVARITPCAENGKGAFVQCLPEGQNGVGSTEFIVLSAKTDVTEPKYIYYLTKRPDIRHYIINRMRGTSGRQRIPYSVFDEVSIDVPPLPEQKKIAAILSSVDEAIEATEAVIEQTRTVKKGLLQELLTRGIGHTEFKKTAIGEIPKSWEVKNVEDISTVIRGASPRPKGDPQFYGGNVPRLMGADVTRDGKYVTPKIDFLTEEGAKRSRPMPAGSLTIVCSGTVGVPAILAVDACIHDGFLGLQDINASCNVEFLYYAFEPLQQQLDAAATHGGVFTNLTTSIMKTFPLPIPPLTEQLEIVKRLSVFDESIQNQKNSLEGLIDIKKGLLQDLLTGKVRVNTLDLPALLNAEAPAEAQAE